MNYQTMTGKSIDQAFGEYHKKNPEVFELFQKFAIQWIGTGADRISAKQIIGRIRWFVNIETVDHAQGRNFKCNDAFTCMYARLFITHYPGFRDKFELRELRYSTQNINNQS